MVVGLFVSLVVGVTGAREDVGGVELKMGSISRCTDRANAALCGELGYPICCTFKNFKEIKRCPADLTTVFVGRRSVNVTRLHVAGPVDDGELHGAWTAFATSFASSRSGSGKEVRNWRIASWKIAANRRAF